MRYVLVNDRWLKGTQRYCVLCSDPIQKTYVRDCQTRLIYCTADCEEYHVLVSEVAIENAARRVA